MYIENNVSTGMLKCLSHWYRAMTKSRHQVLLAHPTIRVFPAAMYVFYDCMTRESIPDTFVSIKYLFYLSAGAGFGCQRAPFAVCRENPLAV